MFVCRLFFILSSDVCANARCEVYGLVKAIADAKVETSGEEGIVCLCSAAPNRLLLRRPVRWGRGYSAVKCLALIQRVPRYQGAEEGGDPLCAAFVEREM
jgi:hypothetical protein